MPIITHWVFLLAKENLCLFVSPPCLPAFSLIIFCDALIGYIQQNTEEMLEKIAVKAEPLSWAGSYDQDLPGLRGDDAHGLSLMDFTGLEPLGYIFSRDTLFAMVYQHKLYAKVSDISSSTKKRSLGNYI